VLSEFRVSSLRASATADFTAERTIAIGISGVRLTIRSSVSTLLTEGRDRNMRDLSCSEACDIF